MALYTTDTIGRAAATLTNAIVLRVIDVVGTPASRKTTLGAIANFIIGLMGFYLSTMVAGGTGAANATAYDADLAAAAGKRIIVPPGTYLLAPTAVQSGRQVKIWYMPGLLITPSVNANATLLFSNLNCDADIDGLSINGLNQIEQAWRSDNGTVRMRNIRIVNMGSLAFPNNAAFGTCGLFLKGCSEAYIDGYYSDNFIAQENNIYADNLGGVRRIFSYNIGTYSYQNIFCKGGSGDDNDFLHWFSDVLPPAANGSLKNSHFEYNHKTRRCLKVQGGKHDWQGLNIVKGADFVAVAPGAVFSPVSGVTQANPAVVTATAHGFTNGQLVRFANISGMTELNGNTYTVANAATNTFELSATDSSGFGIFTTPNGEARRIMQVSGATQANPAVITVTAHGMTNGQKVLFAGVVGMTQLNGNQYEIGAVAANTFELVGINSTGFGAYVSGGEITQVTDIGVENLNCVDWAGSVEGELKLSKSFIDASGFSTGVSKAIGPLGSINVQNCTIVGTPLRGLRNNPEPSYLAQNLQPIGLLTVTTTSDDIVKGNKFVRWNRGAIIQGAMSQLDDNVFDDCCELAFQIGSSTQKQGGHANRNSVITRTAGWLNVSRVSRIDNMIGYTCDDNELIQIGNTGHATTFIGVANASSVGFADRNRAPAGCTAFLSAGADWGITRNQGQTLRPLLVVVDVNNGTTVETNLASHVIPAPNINKVGRSVHGKLSGVSASNANTKTLKFYIGTVDITAGGIALTVSQVNKWLFDYEIVATGASAQKYRVIFTQLGTVGQADIFEGTLTEVSTASITVKATGQSSAASSDITSKLATMHSGEGSHFLFT